MYGLAASPKIKLTVLCVQILLNKSVLMITLTNKPNMLNYETPDNAYKFREIRFFVPGAIHIAVSESFFYRYYSCPGKEK